MKRGLDEQIIDSPQNAAVKRARALERHRNRRLREHTYLAWGVHLAREALRAGTPIRQVLIGPGLSQSEEGRDILRVLRGRGAPILRTTARILESIVEGSGDQGVLLLCARPDHRPEALLSPGVSLAVAAQGVQDPGNVGSILRSALGLGATVFCALPGCADPYGSRAVRASMGAQFFLPVAETTIPVFLRLLDQSGLQLVAADRAGTLTPPEVDLTPPTALIVGSEGSGLPMEVLRAARCRVRIPMTRSVESLNVHAALAILLYETARQRGFRDGP